MINIRETRKYCCEDISLIENCVKAMNDKEVVWHVHHRKGEKQSREQLIEDGLYYDRPASELIFLHPLEHYLVHNPNAKFIYVDSDGVVKKRDVTSRPKRPHGKGYLYQKVKGRGCWRVRWTVNGHRHDENTHCLDREEAEKVAPSIIKLVG